MFVPHNNIVYNSLFIKSFKTCIHIVYVYSLTYSFTVCYFSKTTIRTNFKNLQCKKNVYENNNIYSEYFFPFDTNEFWGPQRLYKYLFIQRE